MFKRIAIGFVVTMFMATFACFAMPRQPGTEEMAVDSQTTFTNVGTLGENTSGNPSFYALTDGDGDVHYLYVGVTGNLLIVSYPTISAKSSWPSGDWGEGDDTMGGVSVGSQS